MKLWASRYALKSLAPLGGRAASQERHGALLKIENAEGQIGYSDLHPWTELGDAALDRQLTLLSQNEPAILAARSLALAQLDLTARSRRVSAFAGLTIPKNHYLATNLEALAEKELIGAWSEGFRTVKLKLGRNLNAELEKLRMLEKILSEFRLRLDFNSLLNAESFADFISVAPASFVKAMELIEDPIPWNASAWADLQKRTDVDLALDRASVRELESVEKSQQSFRWLVVKPAVQSPEQTVQIAKKLALRFFVTSYLDHPVGQSGAALEAARLGVTETCGLVSSRAFAPNEFSEALPWRGPEFIPAAGTGIGFDDLLEKQDWRALT